MTAYGLPKCGYCGDGEPLPSCPAHGPGGYLYDPSVDQLSEIIAKYAEKNGSLMFGGDDYGVPEDGFDSLAAFIIESGFERRL